MLQRLARRRLVSGLRVRKTQVVMEHRVARSLLHCEPQRMYGYAGLLITDDYPGGYSQNFIAPVPDGGTTLLLLGGALMGVGVLRRRIRA